MSYEFQWIRSAIFVIQMYVAMLVYAILFLVPMLFSPVWARRAAHAYCKWVVWTARWIIGLKVEIRGNPPTDAALVAAKHQSFFDIILIFGAMPRPRFIMKHLLLYTPILGQYAYRLGCVPVKRGKRADAIRKMISDVNSGIQEAGQLVIYPQGTRVNPGDDKPYKVGTGILYRELNQPCVPVAVNVGVFWPKRGIYRKPGTAVVEFMEPIPPGLPVDQFMAVIKTQIETKSNTLMQDAGFIK